MIKLAHIHKYHYSEEETLHVLDDINLQVDAEGFLAIMGPSGSGESALINSLGLIDKKLEGTYLLEDHETGDFSDKKLPRIRNEVAGFVFRNSSLVETLTVEENIELPPLYSGSTPKETRSRVREVPTKVGLPDKGKKYPKQLSGGQQQHVTIARAIVNRSSFIIADEPTGILDNKISEEVLTLFQQLNNEGVTIILVTHDEEATEYCNRLIKARDERILEEVLT